MDVRTDLENCVGRNAFKAEEAIQTASQVLRWELFLQADTHMKHSALFDTQALRDFTLVVVPDFPAGFVVFASQRQLNWTVTG